VATSAATLIQRTRRFLRDWEDFDALTGSMSASTVSLSVSNTSLYTVRWPLEIEQELVQVTSVASSTVLIGRRGMLGTTAASHVTSSSILLRPSFFSVEILDALNEGLDACFPLLYKPVSNTTLTGDGLTYEFTVPSTTSSVAIPFLSRVEIKASGDTRYQELRSWEVRRSATPLVVFRRTPSSGSTIRLHGYEPFAHLTTTTSTLDAYFPAQAEYLPVLYAASVLLASGEAGRVRVDTGVIDNREQANRVGASMDASGKLLQRFYKRLNDSAMRPMGPHVVSVL
jgi:hypothetical protein